MPETRIGFFPDVAATGWMFDKCPPGYPEYLGLTGYEVIGPECVRVGFCTHLVSSKDLPEVTQRILRESGQLGPGKAEAVQQILDVLEPFLERAIPSRPEMDDWVQTYFAGKTAIVPMLEDLKQCSIFSDLCEGVFSRLSERSPTALKVTHQLLRHNEGLPIQDVFQADLAAARFVLTHPDFLEGVRARLIDKDDEPRWQPNSIEKVGEIDLGLEK